MTKLTPLLDKPEMKEWIREDIAKFPFVMWDRLVDNGNEVCIYGWITRPRDSYKDFLILVFRPGWQGYTTSSVKYEKRIKKILGFRESGSHKCQRVEDFFTGKNIIKI